ACAQISVPQEPPAPPPAVVATIPVAAVSPQPEVPSAEAVVVPEPEALVREMAAPVETALPPLLVNAADVKEPEESPVPEVLTLPYATPVESAHADLWERIRAGFKLPDIDDSLVRKWETYYTSRPDYWQRITDRSKRYLHFIATELERRGMPLEIALLPFIESAYNPEALSRARALGIWQFVPATGKDYGLQQNWWLDNRRDVSVATGSALDYLQRLYGMFGDWQLALASYNWGEGSVRRAINRNIASNKSTDYASLKIPNETRNYLPKLQAVKNLIRAPDKFGVTLPQVPDRPYFTTVNVSRQIDVALAARLADMTVEDFKVLNPAHNRPVMAAVGGQRITLPFDKAEAFVMNLDAYALPLVSWRPYQIKMGERLDEVAPRFGIGVDELKRVNGLTPNKRVVPGFALLVPARSGESPVQLVPAMFKEAPNALPDWHRVRRGESLQSIAQHYGIEVTELRKLNGLAARRSIRAGNRLRLHEGVRTEVAKSKPRSKAAVHGTRKHVVVRARKR
ncbi:MAG: transglycosylase SLT domain-containing protein, partial [Betaproteobacteria bacterium]